MKATALSRRAAVTAAAILAMTAIEAVNAQTADAKLYYGAIAYATNGAGASVWDYPSRSSADQASLDYCGYSSCKVLTNFADCGAVAFDGSTLQGGGGPTLAAAEADAKRRLPGGWIDSWACN